MALFEGCGAALSSPVTLRVPDDMPGNCFGIYHCGERTIDLLPPDEMLALAGPDNIFAPLSAQALFESIVVHELAHAFYDDTPCPHESCLATTEYLAHAMQIASLSEGDRARVTAWRTLDRPVSIEEIGAFIYLYDPSLFALKSWLHFDQQEDRCGWVRRILDGSVIMDFPLE